LNVWSVQAISVSLPMAYGVLGQSFKGR